MDVRRHGSSRWIFLPLALMAASYLLGYFFISRVEITPLGEARIFSSEAAHDLYSPLRWLEESMVGRPTMFSD
jgi:hypothetical protein